MQSVKSLKRNPMKRKRLITQDKYFRSVTGASISVTTSIIVNSIHDQLLGLQIRNDSSPFSDSIAPFGFGGQPSMWTKEIGKCYHLWINPQLLEKLTHVCCFFQDNGKQTVFVSYKQQGWSVLIYR